MTIWWPGKYDIWSRATALVDGGPMSNLELAPELTVVPGMIATTLKRPIVGTLTCRETRPLD
jgi:hypothetical protein